MSSFCKCKSCSHFFSKNISVYAIFDDQRFNDTLTDDILSFEQLGPGVPHMLKIRLFHQESTNILSKCRTKSTKWHMCPEKDSDQPGHPPSLISLCYLQEDFYLGSLTSHSGYSENSDQTGQMPRLI